MYRVYLVTRMDEVLGIYGTRAQAESKAAQYPDYVWITEYNTLTGEPV